MAIPLGAGQNSVNAALSSFINRSYLEQQIADMGYRAFDGGAPVIVSPDRDALAFRFQLKLKANAAVLTTWEGISENQWGLNKLESDPADTINDPDLIEFLGLSGFENQYVWLLSELQALEEAQDENRIILVPNYSTRRLNVVASLPIDLQQAVSIIINYLSGGISVVLWSEIQGDKDYNDLINTPDLSLYVLLANLAAVSTSGDYGDLNNPPNLSQYLTSADIADLATQAYVNGLFGSLPDFNQFLISDDLTPYATQTQLDNYALASSLPDFSQFLTEVEIGDVSGLQSALDSSETFAKGRFGRRGGTMVIDGGQNFSVTRTSAGLYEVAFINPRPAGDTNYLVVTGTSVVANEQTERSPRTANPRNYTNLGFQIYCAVSGGGEDHELVNFVVYDL
ncbi:MAG: hypothetical protein ACFB0C_20875 [Leptolyngbyaceae cyanobacterium]